MNKEIIAIGHNEIEKRKFHLYKILIFLRM